MIRSEMRRIAHLAWPLLVRARATAAPLLGTLRGIHAKAMTIPGWINGKDARAMVQAALALEGDPVIVEVGIFMGRSTALLAGARKMRGGGMIHCIDPFDGSGDDYSTPIYADEMHAANQSSLEAAFRRNMARHDLQKWIIVHKGSSASISRKWTQPIDLLLLDADYSADGARAIFNEWVPFLKKGGLIMLPNSRDRIHAPGHDGNRRLVVEELVAPRFVHVRTINDLTIAERAQ